MHEAYAQQQLAEPAVNENINAELNSNGIAYITHEVFNKQLDSPVALIDGTVSEIRVTDMEGNAIEYTFSNSDGTIYVEDGNDYEGEKSISFDYVGEHFVTIEMPQELLWNPYQVFLGDTQILSHSIEMEDGTVQITFKPAESGTITIIGISVIPEIPVAALVFVTIAGMSSAIIVGRKYSSLP